MCRISESEFFIISNIEWRNLEKLDIGTVDFIIDNNHIGDVGITTILQKPWRKLAQLSVGIF